MDYLTTRGLFADAMMSGTRHSLMRVSWNISNNCSNPVTRIHYAKPYSPDNLKEIVVKTGHTPIPLEVELDVRCRKCKNCLLFRRRQWSARAIYEYRNWPRTWLGTLTLKPSEHDQVLNLCRQHESANARDFDLLSGEDQFNLRHKRISRWLTLWLKRVRKNSGAKMRYMIVCEAHKSNLPHYHALVHEMVEDQPIKKRVLQAAWPHGFTNFHLVKDYQSWGATYACKYLSKSDRARVRASVAYGSTTTPLRGIKTDPSLSPTLVG